MMVAAVLVTQWSTIILYHWRHLHELLSFSIAIYLLLFCIVQLFISLDLWCAVSPYFGLLSLFFTWSVQLVRVWKLNSIKFYLKCTCNSSVYSAILNTSIEVSVSGLVLFSCSRHDIAGDKGHVSDETVDYVVGHLRNVQDGEFWVRIHSCTCFLCWIINFHSNRITVGPV